MDAQCGVKEKSAAGGVIVWFRRDLRLADQPALAAGVAVGRPVVPVYIWSPEEEGDWPPGAASRWWLHHSLTALDADLRRRGSRLVVRRGPALATLRRLVEETGAAAVYWCRRYEPAGVQRDSQVKAALKSDGVDARSFNGSLAVEPWELGRPDARPFTVFAPFGREWRDLGEAVLTPAPERLAAPSDWPPSLDVNDLSLRPTRNWADGFSEWWTPGEAGAGSALGAFTDRWTADAGPGEGDYRAARHRPDDSGTSRLSPHLAFGEVAPGRVRAAVLRTVAEAPPERRPAVRSAAESYLRQL
ncbi:MAG: deoxyribodipyrimidine photo-lyase, partial [Planctomycetia bacterium]